MDTPTPVPRFAAAAPGAPERSGIRKFFENHWEKMALWAILIGLFYLLKSFFLLIFATFLISYITKSLAQWMARRTRWNYRLTTVIVFLLFIGLLGAAVAWIGPKLIAESNRILNDFAGGGEGQTREKINRFATGIVVKAVGEEKAQAVIDSEGYATLIAAVKTQATQTMTATLPKVFQGLIHIIRLGWAIAISLFLAIVFSFILVLDWEKISAAVRMLERSRIRTFYLGAAPHLAAFANVLGRAFRAQTIVAVCNTALTAAGLWFFDVPNIALLSTVVFFCGFIPILGTFLSSIPILIFGLESGGLFLAFKLAILIAVVHAIEAYGLNPKITANILHIHPILVLVLLLLGERFFGIWGMVLGVPIGYYIISVLTQRDDTLAREAAERTPQPPPL